MRRRSHGRHDSTPFISLCCQSSSLGGRSFRRQWGDELGPEGGHTLARAAPDQLESRAAAEIYVARIASHINIYVYMLYQTSCVRKTRAHKTQLRRGWPLHAICIPTR